MSNLGEDPLPDGWLWTTIPMLTGYDGVFVDGDWVESKDQDPSGEVRLVQLADIGDGHYRDRSDRFLTQAKAHDLRCTFLEAEDVLIARMPDPLGRACVFPGDAKRCVTVVDVCIVRSGSIQFSHRWLAAFINASSFRVAVAGLQSGSTRKRISRGNLATIPIPFPPLSEQRRIVAKLEELFSELDAGVAALRRAQRRLARYRQSLLQAAVTGELTREWREARTHDIKLGKLGDLPEGWTRTSLGALSRDSSYGTSCKCSYENTGIAVLRIPNVQKGCLQFDDLKRAPDTARFNSNDHLDIGDLLIIRTNGSRNLIGRAAVVTSPTPEPLTFASYLICFRIIGDASTARWTALALAAPSGRAWLEPMAATTAGQYNLSASKLAGFPICLPPQQEREAILDELDRRLSAADALEATFQASLRRAERLRQSILERAFRGELVPQDPHDEPAEALLVRLKAAAPDTPAPRRRGRPPKAEPAEPQAPRRCGRPRKAAPLASGGSA